jgi:hypothetical protein
MFEIEKGYTPPPPARGRSLYPFSQMEIEDSFFVPCGDDDVRTVERRVSASAAQYGRRTSTKYTTRREDDGVRVWRIE